MRKTFTVTQVPGSKRSSDRDYTHAVIGHFNHDIRIKDAAIISKTDISNHNYELAHSAMQDGDIYTADFGKGDIRKWPVRQESIDHAKAYISKYPTVESMVAARVKEYEDLKAKSGGKFEVLRWSQSFANANKSLGEFSYYYLDIQIVETVRIK